MMRSILRGAAALFVVLALSSCGFTPQGDFIRDTVRDRGAQAYDEGLETSLWFLCSAASIGSIRRRFGASGETAAAYNAICAPVVNIIGGA